MPIQQTTPPEAQTLLAQGYRYIDVRTEPEFADGHPAGAVNIPVVVPDTATQQMAVNPDFLRVVASHFPPDSKIIVGCQMGGRSQRAAEMLAQAGYATVVNMQGGFGGSRDVPGWRDSGLPVSTECGPNNSYSGLRGSAK